VRGYRVVTRLFEEIDSADLRGTVVFLPMVRGDDAAAAQERAAERGDARLECSWDATLSVGQLFKKTLGLHTTAWDVYLVYEPGAVWRDESPPPPAFWMHQLSRWSGAPRGGDLEPERLAAEIRRALSATRPARDLPAHAAW